MSRVRPSGIVTLLTDFGTADAFVGIMKGVALGVHAGLQLVDLSHEIPPQAIAVGALLLRSAVTYFPAGCVHCAVVDPGVGSSRAAIAVLTDSAILVGPDNGLLAPASVALGGARDVFDIENEALFRQPLSRTFHGRDLFAPVAAHLARGVDAASLGARRQSMTPLALPQPLVTEASARGEVIHVDRFGNLLTNLGADILAAFRGHAVSVTVADMSVAALVATYADAAPGATIALVSSWGALEVAVRDGNAAAQLGVGRGATVVVARSEPRV